MFKGKWVVPLPKVKAVSESEAFKVVKTGKSRRKLIYHYSSNQYFLAHC